MAQSSKTVELTEDECVLVTQALLTAPMTGNAQTLSKLLGRVQGVINKLEVHPAPAAEDAESQPPN